MLERVLIITGMHRSGTSLITNWLHHCGLQVGEKLLGAATGNTEGHFEDTEFLKIHEEILADNGLSITGLIFDQQLVLSEYELEKIKAVLTIKARRYTQWGWKEPRTCLFLDTYRKLLPEAKYLVIVRNFGDVVSSLLNRAWAEIDDQYMRRSLFTRLKWQYIKKPFKKKSFYRRYAGFYLQVWIDYNQHILAALEKTKSENFMVISYTMLQIEDKRIFLHLEQKWGFALQYVPFNSIYKQNLISTKPAIEHLISDMSIINKAHQLETAFQKYMVGAK